MNVNRVCSFKSPVTLHETATLVNGVRPNSSNTLDMNWQEAETCAKEDPILTYWMMSFVDETLAKRIPSSKTTRYSSWFIVASETVVVIAGSECNVKA